MIRAILLTLAASAALSPALATTYGYQQRYTTGAEPQAPQTFSERYGAPSEGEIGTALSTRCTRLHGRHGVRELCRIVETPGRRGWGRDAQFFFR
ncbi:hypothetical protein C4N9_04760 [Pararhodobacter marinus]|uniref:Uncharacterized protein n=1 Tax=Pararhodobacter marinus TaxID=2184063 RepID=A0A2U2CGQ1_9RHOB|nr:hypothetical protein [Pararhodobacter marinus]PWE31065.1 hypothetical protein C4N9_04760 [Pararhodobacter marinus]